MLKVCKYPCLHSENPMYHDMGIEAASACDISVCFVVKCNKYTCGYRNQHFV